MLAGITDHVWGLEELMEAALAEPAGEKPTPKPLAIPRPVGPARELPNGRGFLRVVQGGGQPAAPPPPPAAPAVAVGAPPAPIEAPPVAPPAPAAPSAPTPEPAEQLDLLSYRPRPRSETGDAPTSKRLDATPGQLSLLFGIDIDPEPKK